MSARAGVVACALLLVLFAFTSYSAVLTKAPTFDEPVEALSGWLRLHYGDFRFNFEDPPLWQEWSALPSGPDLLHPDFQSPEWQKMADNPPLQYRFATATLFNTPGVDGASFINRGRAMMLIVGVLLGALIALWAWRLGGPIAAVTALGLFALDPTFLGHAPLVKNDVAMTFCFVGIAFLLWRNGQRVTWGRAIGLVVACALTANVKFSAILLLPVIALLIGLRVFAPAPWPVLDRQRVTWRSRLVPAGLLVVAMAGLTWGATWSFYRFRFGGTPDPNIHINFDWMWEHLRKGQTSALHFGHPGGAEDQAVWNPDLISRLMRWLYLHRVMPEAWVTGFLHTYGTSSFRRSFLLNELRPTGWRYYFPLAMLFKTPIATLAAIGAATIAGVRLLRQGKRPFETWWTVACLVLPPGLYFAASLQAHANIGVRHVLPTYGFIFIACGVVAAAAVRRWGRLALIAIGATALVLAAETARAAPNFIAFFNTAAGGSRNGINLLGDSNLDWGQDLMLLAEWQQRNPNVNLYLSYFGMVDPAFYGIKYHPMVGNYMFGPPPDEQPVALPAVYAISASHIQGIAMGRASVARYSQLKERQPLEVLGGTIYLFDTAPDQ